MTEDDPTSPEQVTVPHQLIQQLLSTTTGSAMDRERVAGQVRELLMSATLETEPGTHKTADPDRPNPGAAPRPNQDNVVAGRQDCAATLTIRGSPVPLPKFSGYEDTQSPPEFLERYKEYCDICGISADRRVQLLPASLEGSAKKWWKFTGGFASWPEFEQEFTREFTTVDHKDRLKAELEQRTQHPAENLKEFIHVISEFYDRIGEPVSDAEKVSRVRRQMHPTFQDMTASTKFANLHEMAKAAGSVMERAWHRLRYVPPPPRTDQVAADLAFVRTTGQAASAIATTSATAISAPSMHVQQEWPLQYTAVHSGARFSGQSWQRANTEPGPPTLRAEAPSWVPHRSPYDASAHDQSWAAAPLAGQHGNGPRAPPTQGPRHPPANHRRVYARGREQQNIVCHRCGGIGHFARDCATGRTHNQYDGRRCFTCNQPGHFRAQCPGNAPA